MRKSRNKTVEIYFVLYLAAIIFLLPDKLPTPDEENQSITMIEGPFRLQPVKTSLVCRYFSDSSGAHILSIDSINTIMFTGDVEDINFSFEVEDLALRQRQVLRKSSKYFSFEENIEKHELNFYWNPPMDEQGNKTYTIKVKASAREKRNETKPESSSLYYSDETQFSLLMIDVTEQLAANIFGQPTTGGITQSPTNPTTINYPGYYTDLDINIEPILPEVKALAFQNWTNKVNIYGANAKNELVGKPDLKITLFPQDNNGSAQITGISDNEINITGRTPSYGKMKVSVSLKFRQKNLTKSIEFWVIPIVISKPKFASIMYPDKLYLIEPNLPFESGWETEAIITDKERKKEITKSNQGENISFRPSVNLIGKELTLERIINGIKYDSYDLRVDDYPNPEIYDIKGDSQDEVIITTRSYGTYNGRNNDASLDMEGNISFVIETRGTYKSEDITIFQSFKCRRKNSDKPFEFVVKAIDKRGKESSQKKYPR